MYRVTLPLPVQAESLTPRGARVLDTSYGLYHIHDGSAQVLTSQVSGDTLTFTTDNFSTFLLQYTVDFEYIDPITGEKYAYALTGGNGLQLSALLNSLVIEADLTGSTAEFSAPELVTLSPISADGVTTDWLLTSQQPFDTEERLTVTLANGAEIILRVTDEQIVTYLMDARGDTYVITVTYDRTAQIPENAVLRAAEITADSDGYADYLAQASLALAENERLLAAKLYDISIYADGEKVEPAAPVDVLIEFIPMARTAGDSYALLHYEDGSDVPTLMEDPTFGGGEDEVRSVAFSTDSFSVYAVAEYVLETTIDIDGQTYKVTATYDDRAGLPGDAKLRVSEKVLEADDYLTYFNDTAAALGVSARELGYLRMLDISIVGEDGAEYKPNDFVKVSVELIDDIENGALRVVHLGDEAEELRTETDGDTVSFETKSFSIFSFVDISLIQNVVDAVFGSTYTDKRYENDDIIVSGKMPRTAIVEANPAEVTIEGADVLVSYDIKIYAGLITKALGIAWQPSDGALTVQMKSDSLTGRDSVSVYHIADGSSTPEKVTDVDVYNNSVEFQANSFSVYVLGDRPLRSYRFFSLNENGEYVEYHIQTDSGIPTFTQIIKDASEGLVIPQLPSIPGSTTSTFSGWYVGHDVTHNGAVYSFGTLDDDPFDFNDIPPVTETEEIDLFAKFADYAYVIFHDQFNGSVNTFPVALTRRGEKNQLNTFTNKKYATVQIDDVTVAYDSENNEQNSAPSMAFYGWSYTKIKTPGSPTDDDGRAVSRIAASTIDVYEPTHLYPIFESIKWLNYYSGPTGSGATYIPSKYYYVGEGPTSLSVPVRSGYTFQGWYTGTLTAITDSEGKIISETVNYGTQVSNADGFLVSAMNDVENGVTVSGGMLTLSKDATLFAKWENANVNYTVVIWRQKATDEAGLTNENKTYDYAESFVLTATTGASVSVEQKYTQLTNDTTYNSLHSGDQITSTNPNPYYGFNYNSANSTTSSVTVNGDGSTVLNVYYDRKEWKLEFQVQDYVYTISANDNDNNPEKYGDVNGQKVRVYWNNGYFRTTNSRDGTVYNGTVYTRSNNQSWQTIKTIEAVYEHNISDQFPIKGNNGVTYNNGERWAPQTNAVGWGQVMVYVDIMPNGNVTFHLNTSNAGTKTMNYYVEALPDETGTTYNYGGKTFILYNSISSNYNGITEEDYVELVGFSKHAVNPSYTYNNGNYTYYVGSSGSATAATSVDFYYTRDNFNIEFYDSYTHQLAYVNGSQLNSISVKYQEALAGYVPATPTAMQIVNINGVPTPQVRPGYTFTGWYTDEGCSTRIFFSQEEADEKKESTKDRDGNYHYVVWDTMPAHALKAYAGWETEWYLIQIDPNYGSMNNGTSDSTWFWEAYNGDPIEEYTWVTRDYVESSTGTYYYVKHDRAYYGYTSKSPCRLDISWWKAPAR